MAKQFALYRKSICLGATTVLLAFPVTATETTRDPYASCVAAETAAQPGSVTAEARARQKCRKLYPSATPRSETTRVQPPSEVPLPSTAPSPAMPTTTTPSSPVVEAPAAVSAPTPAPMPAVPTAGHPHGGPPGLNK